jgi:hypothetical protein
VFFFSLQNFAEIMILTLPVGDRLVAFFLCLFLRGGLKRRSNGTNWCVPKKKKR